MGRINILDSTVYNQISAGEVVENPASVVKELVENSIDAGADNICVMIEEGGIKSISVVDNGHGIEKNDLEKTILPHATSKIASVKDLLTIGTLGFRGEALASIAAVSEVIIKSKFAEAENAYQLNVKAGAVSEPEITNFSIGTGITVNNLFFNTPARYKFLKSPKGEESGITKLMQEFILSNPYINFKYYIDNKIIYQNEGNGLQDAIYAIYSSDIAKNLIPIDYKENKYIINGFIGKPSTSAIGANRNRQTFIINGRIINDNILSMVIQNAYGERLMKRNFPLIILDIVMPFELIDVNVHPNKREVRFANRKFINGIVYNAIKEALEKQENVTQNSIIDILSKQPVVDNVSKPYTVDIPNSYFVKNDKNIGKQINQEYKFDEEIAATKLIFNDNFDNEKEYLQENVTQKVQYRIIGQLFDTYILTECNDRFFIIDQHAVHERQLYEKLLEESTSGIVAQELLFPYVIDISDNNIENILEQLNILSSLGFDFEIISNKLKLKTIPYLLINMDINSFVNELIEEVGQLGKITDIKSIKEKIARIACKKAIKGGDKLNNEQMDYVINYFIENGFPLQCPHGRPTIIIFTKTEIEKLFRRIV